MERTEAEPLRVVVAMAVQREVQPPVKPPAAVPPQRASGMPFRKGHRRRAPELHEAKESSGQAGHRR